MRRGGLLAPLLALILASVLAPPASADDALPPGFEVSREQAIESAAADGKVRRAEDELGELEPRARPEDGRWRVSFYDGSSEVVQAYVDPRRGEVTESWDGYHVAWRMARGYPGAFGRSVNAPYVWLPLCAIFLIGLADWRRPRRIVHLDLVVLLSFGVSHVFFNRAMTDLSVPLVYPALLYLLARLLWIGLRGRGPGLSPSIPVSWLAIALVFLLTFRIGLNVTDANVIDVGYAGVIGADRLTSGDDVYGNFPSDNHAGDTYGPAAYYAYVPFELVWPWSGRWDGLPAAHGAAIFFDLLVVAGLVALGRRLRPGGPGSELGIVLAFGWAAFPYSAFVLMTNANDALVAALVVWALVALSSPPLRGALLAAAALTKFAPAALGPLIATWRDPSDGERPGPLGFLAARGRPAALTAIGFAATATALMTQTALGPGLATFWERTVAFQAGRDSPFSVWNQWDLGSLQVAVQVAAVGLAAAVALVPRRKTGFQVAALAGAVLIAVQLGLSHWFYLYVVWFAPVALAALAMPAEGRVSPRRAPGPGRSTQRGRRRSLLRPR